MKTLVLLSILSLLALPVVLAHGGEGGEDVTEQLFHATGSVTSGGFAEVDFEAHENASIAWSVSASDPVTVNIHQHQHVETVYYARHNDTRSASGSFMVPSDGVYSLMVVGSGPEEADVEVELEGVFGVVETLGLEAEQEAPAPGLPLIVLVIGAVAAAVHRRR